MKPSAIVEEMRRASALVDEAPDHLQYQTRLIALALIARQFLRETAVTGNPSKDAGRGQDRAHPDAHHDS